MTKHNYREVTQIRTESGLVGTVTARETAFGSETFSFAIRREYDKDGEVQGTAWMQKHHLAEYRELLNKIEVEMQAAEDKSREAARRKG